MSSKLAIRALAGAVALALGSTAMANTTLDATTTGDLFFSLVDTSTTASFLFDTGVPQASFTSGSSYSHDVSGDANYQAFLTAAGSDTLSWSVLSATRGGTTATIQFTSSLTPSSVAGAQINQAQSGISGFFGPANGTTSGTNNSAFLTGASGNGWGAASNGPFVSTKLLSDANAIFAAPGTPLAMYSETSNNLNSTTIHANLSAAFASTWNFANGLLTYGSVSAVPLPTPIVLLLSGLGLMALVARRKSSSTDEMASGAAAA